MKLAILCSLCLQLVIILLLFDDVITTTTKTTAAAMRTTTTAAPLIKYEYREKDIRGLFGQRIIKSFTATPLPPSSSSTRDSLSAWYGNQNQSSRQEESPLQQFNPDQKLNRTTGGIDSRNNSSSTINESKSTSPVPVIIEHENTDHENTDHESREAEDDSAQEDDDDADEFTWNPAYRLQQEDGDELKAHDSDHDITYMDPVRRRRISNPEADARRGSRRGIEEDYEFLIPSSRSTWYPRSGIPPPPPPHSASQKQAAGIYFPIDSYEGSVKHRPDDDATVVPYNIHRQIDPSVRLILNHKALATFLITNQRIMNSPIRRVKPQKWQRVRYVDLFKLEKQESEYHKWRPRGNHQRLNSRLDWANLIG